MQKFIYAIGGAAIASIALFVTVIQPQMPNAISKFTKQMPMADGIEGTAESMMRNQYGGGGRAGGGGGGMMDSTMIAPGEPYEYTVTEYNYAGDITLPEGKVIEGFTRTQLKSSQKADLLSNTFVSKMIDVSKVSGLNVVNVTLSETGKEPLMVTVDFTDGNIGINRQFDYAALPQNKCRDESCFQKYRLKKSDMLSTEKTISIAESFLTELGIDISQYGQPELQDDWEKRQATEPNAANFYFPEQVSVTYPYTINGVQVLDEWGNSNGVNVSIDIRSKKAIGVWGIRTMDLAPKKYTKISNQETVLSLVKKGGMNAYLPPEAKKVQAELAEPRMVYIMHYDWNQDSQIGAEVYVPALAFPVIKMPEGSYEYRKAVVVPLAQEIVDSVQEQGYPTPYMEDVAE